MNHYNEKTPLRQGYDRIRCNESRILYNEKNVVYYGCCVDSQEV